MVGDDFFEFGGDGGVWDVSVCGYYVWCGKFLVGYGGWIVWWCDDGGVFGVVLVLFEEFGF